MGGRIVEASPMTTGMVYKTQVFMIPSVGGEEGNPPVELEMTSGVKVCLVWNST